MTDRLAALDVGTNSFHLVVARVLPGGRFEVIAREREMVRLGEGGGDMKHLSGAAMDRAVATLKRMRQLADASAAELRAVATSAMREAENRDELVQRARAEAGVEIEVVSGLEEARLIHLGVLQALDVFDRRISLCDIGGGSTELVIGHRGEMLAARSLKLGAVRLTTRFFTAERTTGKAIAACRAYVRSALAPFVREAEAHRVEVPIGSSGTVEAVVKMVHQADGAEPMRTYNGYEVSTDQVLEVVERLISARTVAARRKIRGLEPARADIVLAGALILEQTLLELGFDSIRYSDFALREGVLLDTLARRTGGTMHHLGDVSRRGVRHLAELCDGEPAHAAQVARLALSIFDQTALLHGLDEGCREYLEAGALLANVGLFISHSKHHVHSYYVIRNSEHLTGFTDAEIEIVALLARYHRKSAPKPSHPEFARLRPDEQRIVRVLAGILRIAIGLDRCHADAVAAVDVHRHGQRLYLDLIPNGDIDLDLELYAASERSDLLAEALEVTVDVRRKPAPNAPVGRAAALPTEDRTVRSAR